MRHALIIIVLLLLLCLQSGPSAQAEDAVPMMAQVGLSRVCPSYPGEFVTIRNDGPPVDLDGWRLSDGEGSVTFDSLFVLQTGTSISWCESPERFSALYPDEDFIYRNSTGLLLKGVLKLADQGDEVFLYDANGTMADILFYGRSEPLPPWNGPSAICRKGDMMVRSSESIGFNSWTSEAPGMYSITTAASFANVTPILYPEDGLSAMVREIDRSQSSIDMAVYIMENWTLARHLCMASSRGVDVTLLLEGQPVGGMTDNGAAIAYYLQNAGVEVSVMRSSDSFRRYDYLHAKYLVFDQERLLVSSENMADSSFRSNRGWAVLVESALISRDALDIFHRDLAGTGVDVFPLELSVPRQEGGPGKLLSYDRAALPQFPATARLSTSPFEIMDDMISVIEGAQDRLLVQQMSIDEDWIDGHGIMEGLYRAAGRGVSVRILLDAEMGTKESNGRVVAALNTMSLENGWDLECRTKSDESSFGRLHNKGVIADDTVIVGSANWVDGSMERNREMVMVLTSTEVADVYASWFMDDWRGDAQPPTIVLPWHYLDVPNGRSFVLDATACSDRSGIAEFSWDLDGDGAADLNGPLHTMALPAGLHNITLTISDTVGNNASDTITVNVVHSSAGIPVLLLYAPLPIMAIIILLRRIRGKIF